jgi:hypothetical protein
MSTGEFVNLITYRPHLVLRLVALGCATGTLRDSLDACLWRFSPHWGTPKRTGHPVQTAGTPLLASSRVHYGMVARVPPASRCCVPQPTPPSRLPSEMPGEADRRKMAPTTSTGRSRQRGDEMVVMDADSSRRPPPTAPAAGDPVLPVIPRPPLTASKRPRGRNEKIGIVLVPLQGFPPIATNPLGNTTISVAIGGYYCTETVIWLQFVCLLQHKI